MDRIISSIPARFILSSSSSRSFSRFFFFSFNFTDQLIRARCSIFASPMKLHFFSELERVYTRMSFEFVLFLYLMNDEEFLE